MGFASFRQALCLCAFVSFLFSSSGAHAVPLTLSFGHKTVADTVSYTPNLPDGGFATPTKRSRFKESSIEVLWQGNNRLSVAGEISNRQFTSLRDDFGFVQSQLAFRYAIQNQTHNSTTLFLGYSVNKANELTKNSYTTIDNLVINSATVLKPSDRKLELGLEHTFQYNTSTRLLVFASLGATDTSHSGLIGNFTRGDCNYKFGFTNHGGSVDLLNQCGRVTSLNRTYPNDNTVQQEFGISPATDLRNKARLVKVGFGLDKSHQYWNFSTRYYFQRYSRDQLDQNIRAAGNEAHDSNHVLSIEARYKINRKITISAQTEYHIHRYLDEVPVLYTRLTSDRFKDDAVFISLGFTYNLAN